MDLALATGRGEALLAEWPGIEGPLVPDAAVVQIGERENRNADFAWPDVNDTDITRIDVFEAREIGASRILQRTRHVIDRAGYDFWVHLDVDVLDERIMPAVDSPGRPGIDPDQIASVLGDLMADERFVGLTLTVFDPDLDPDGQFADRIVSLFCQAETAPASA